LPSFYQQLFWFGFAFFVSFLSSSLAFFKSSAILSARRRGACEWF
jgi:hypothetical protein